jgi:type IV pilus assembly protein PilW
MFKRPMPKPKAQRGISLVEVMVGMAIGLLASLVIFKAFTSSETFRRNVGGAADTVQTAAVVGARLNLMLEEGGAGLVQGRNIWSCLLKVNRAGSPLLPVSSFPAPFESFPKSVRVLPVGIRDGGTGSDTVMVIAANSPSSNRDIPFDSTGTSLTVSNPNGIGLKDAGQSTTDLLLAVAQDVAGGPADCQIVQVAADYSGGTPTQDISLGLAVMPAAAKVVSPASYTVIPLNQGELLRRPAVDHQQPLGLSPGARSCRPSRCSRSTAATSWSNTISCKGARCSPSARTSCSSRPATVSTTASGASPTTMRWMNGSPRPNPAGASPS